MARELATASLTGQPTERNHTRAPVLSLPSAPGSPIEALPPAVHQYPDPHVHRRVGRGPPCLRCRSITCGRRPRCGMEGHTGDEDVLPAGRSGDYAPRGRARKLIPGHSWDTPPEITKRRRDEKPCGALDYGWSLLDSNQRPLRCERSALPAELSDPLRAPPHGPGFLQYPHGESNPGFLAENQVS